MKLVTSIFIMLNLSLASLPADRMTYKTVSEGKTTVEVVGLSYTQADGLDYEVFTGKDSATRLGRDKNGKLVALEFAGKEGKYTFKQVGDVLVLSGTLDGKKVDSKLTLNGKIWAVGFDQALRWIKKNNLKSVVFIMADPGNLQGSREMEINYEASESILGRSALRYRVNVTGFMSLFWSALLWSDATTGENIQFKGDQGPGTPQMISTSLREKE